MTKSVLFVCTGNTCRSFMAEQLLRYHAAKNKLTVEVASAGLAAFAGDNASEYAVQVLDELGIDGKTHRSRQVHHHLLEQFDLILPMTESHKEQLLSLAPQLAERIFLLKELAESVKQEEEPGESVAKDFEIRDPFGQSLDVYRQSRDEIDQAVQAIVQHFLEGESSVKIVIGADHGGFRAKQSVVDHLLEQGYDLEDYGTDSEESCDYPDIAHKVAQAVAKGEFTLGILMCGTGIGVSIAANKVPGIRAALCTDSYSARMARNHNNSNVLCMGARVTGIGPMLDIVDSFIQEGFQGGRHSKRVDKIEKV